jgi:hypothetical protein
MKYFALFLVIALSGTGVSFAQSTTTSLPSGWVDGSKSPSLIPDRIAYRLTFINLMLHPSEADSASRQEARIKQIGLSAADEAALKLVLATFASNYTTLKQTPGATAAQAWELVQATQSSLISQLSGDGNSKFGAYVALAKTHMYANPNN